MTPAFLKSLAAALISIVILAPEAVSQQSFEEFQRQQQQALESFLEEDSAAFAKYKADIEQKWQDFLDSSREEWVSYGTDKETKTVVNFDSGYVEIEALVEVSEPEAIDKAQEKIKRQFVEIVTSEDASSRVILKEQLKTEKGQTVTKKNAQTFAKEAAATAIIVNRKFKGKDGVERLRVKVRVLMVPDHLQRRANNYLSDVREFCNQYDFDIAMVMALIHTESYFNPRAKSKAPAYGLMQLVPKSGGREAYKYVFNKDKAPSPSYLYVPRNNIQLGIAYLAKLRRSYFKDVKNSQNALYCIICAYNTGPGNVAKGIVRSSSIKKAVERINMMSPDELFRKLVRDLPYKETRDYIKKVKERTPNYVAWR